MAEPTPLDNTAFYLKIEGIKGETLTDGLTDYIKIVQFSWGGKHDGSFARDEGPSTGRFAGSDFSFATKTNTASPELMQACASGKTFPKATLICRKSSTKPLDYLKVTLTPVMISEFETGYDPKNNFGDAVVVDRIKLNFGKIVVEYRPDKDGTPGPAREGGYDLQRGKTGK